MGTMQAFVDSGSSECPEASIKTIEAVIDDMSGFVTAHYPLDHLRLVVYDVTGTAVGETGSVPSSEHLSR